MLSNMGKTGKFAAVALSAALSVTLLTPAAAVVPNDPAVPVGTQDFVSNGRSTTIYGSGSDTTYQIHQDFAVLFNRAAGCQLQTPISGNQRFDMVCNETQTAANGRAPGFSNYDRDLASEYHFIGSGGGRSHVDGWNEGTAGFVQADYFRSSSFGTAGQNRDARFIAYARDALATFVFDKVETTDNVVITGPANNPTVGGVSVPKIESLTAAQVKDIFQGNIKCWASLDAKLSPIHNTDDFAPFSVGLTNAGTLNERAIFANASTRVATATVASNVATITTGTFSRASTPELIAANHGLVANDTVTLYNLTSGSGNVQYTVIAAPTLSTFTIALTRTNGAISLGTNTAVTKVSLGHTPADNSYKACVPIAVYSVPTTSGTRQSWDALAAGGTNLGEAFLSQVNPFTAKAFTPAETQLRLIAENNATAIADRMGHSDAGTAKVITGATVADNVATITTGTAHNFVRGNTVNLLNLTAGSGNVEYSVIAATATTFTVAYIAANGALTLGSTPGASANNDLTTNAVYFHGIGRYTSSLGGFDTVSGNPKLFGNSIKRGEYRDRLLGAARSAALAISSATVASNVATVTTASVHGYAVGNRLTLVNLIGSSSVEYTVVSVPTTTTFTIALTRADGAITLGSSPTTTPVLILGTTANIADTNNATNYLYARSIYAGYKYPNQATRQFLDPVHGFLCTTANDRLTDPINSSNARTQIEDIIKRNGFIPLTAGPVGATSGRTGNSYCRQEAPLSDDGAPPAAASAVNAADPSRPVFTVTFDKLVSGVTSSSVFISEFSGDNATGTPVAATLTCTNARQAVIPCLAPTSATNYDLSPLDFVKTVQVQPSGNLQAGKSYKAFARGTVGLTVAIQDRAGIRDWPIIDGRPLVNLASAAHAVPAVVAAPVKASQAAAAVPASLKSKKKVTIPVTNSAGLTVKVTSSGCKTAPVVKTTKQKVGKKTVTTKKTTGFAVTMGKKGSTCTVTQSNAGNDTFNPLNAVTAIKVS